MFYSAVYAAVLTAFWAIQNRTVPLRGVLFAFVLVGCLAAAALAVLPSSNEPLAVDVVVRAAVLLAAYQTALFAAFSGGSKFTQAVVNLNIVVIIILDAIALRTWPRVEIVAACLLQILGATLACA